MKIRGAIFMAGIYGMACSVVLYVALLAVWPTLPVFQSLWLLPIHARPEMLAAWIIGALLVIGAWLFGRRLSPFATVLMASVLVIAPAVWILVDQGLIHASVDQWPTFGSEMWRIYIAPTYSEYAITAFLGFGTIAALTAARHNHQNPSADS